MLFTGVSTQKAEFLTKLWSKLNTPAEGYTLAFKAGADFTVEKQGKEILITCQGDTQQYRSLLLAAQLILGQKEGKITQSKQFERVGVMLDLSRAGVMQVQAVKDYMEFMALCGLNALMLYIEDIYTVEGRKYFGYMRGRYTCDELKEIDAYGKQCGIEVIPCMQVLGHMEQYLKWPEAAGLGDNDYVLMADNEKVYEFIDRCFATLSGCFTSKKIHIGLDEAFGLGLGKYLAKNGYKPPFDTFCRHLNRVKEIADRYGLEPMMWSDMYFRLHSPSGSFYDPDIVIPPETAARIPEGVSLVYWDYYHILPETYERLMKRHLALTDNLVFAGGIWLWRGLLPDHQLTFDATNTGLPVCKKYGIKDVYATVWGDDGAETDPLFGLPGVVLYGEHAWESEPNQADTDARMRLLLGADTRDFLDMATACCPLERHTTEQGPSRLNIKYIVYNDILCGLVDAELQDPRLVPIYNQLEQKFAALAQNEGILRTNFAYTAALCRLAAHKIEIAQQLPVGYKSRDKALLTCIKDQLLPQLAEDFEAVKQLHFQMWHKTNRPFGFEVVDTRYGGKVNRITTAIGRLQAYLSGEIDSLPELEEERLPFCGVGAAFSHNSPYTGIYSSYYHK